MRRLVHHYIFGLLVYCPKLTIIFEGPPTFEACPGAVEVGCYMTS